MTGISTDIAEAAKMHESKLDGDVMQIRQVMVPSIRGKERIAFAPGSYHVMPVGLKQELITGEEIQVTLHFKNHEDLVITVPVREMATDDAMNGH